MSGQRGSNGDRGKNTAGLMPSATQSASTVGVALVAAAACLWGTVGIASKELYATVEISPLAIGFLRLGFSLPLLMVLSAAAFGRQTFAFHGRELLLVLLLGGAMALFQLFYFSAVAAAGVAVTTLIAICVAPLLVAVLSGLFLSEPLTVRVALALAAGLAGTALLVGTPADDPAAEAFDGAMGFAGIAWACGAALSYAVFTLCSRALAQRHHPFKLIVVGFGAAAVVLLPFAVPEGVPPDYPAKAWGLLLYIGLVPTALAYVIYFRGMRQTPATVASVVTLMEPLTATALAWLLLDERLGPLGSLGGLLLLGSIVALHPRRRL